MGCDNVNASSKRLCLLFELFCFGTAAKFRYFESCSGLPIADAPKKISGVHKRCWRYIPSLSKSLKSKPTSPKSTETATKAEVEAA